LKVFRRVLYLVLCIGVFLSLLLEPHAYPLPIHHPIKVDLFYPDLGGFLGFGMLIWCITFRKSEKVFTLFGWIVAIIGICIVPWTPAIP
jgi:hypothetical protein